MGGQTLDPGAKLTKSTLTGTLPHIRRIATMAWKKPRVTEVSVAMEINCYACAEV